MDADAIEQDNTVYTYEDRTNIRKPIKREQQTGREVSGSEHATDGEFQPKERMIVSEEAKKTMNRKPFAEAGTVSAEQLMEQNVSEDTPKKASSEGKIIAPTKKKLKTC